MPIKATRTVRITYGLISVAANVYGASEDSGPTLHLVHEDDDGSAHRITTRYLCKHPDCGEVMDFGHCGRGVQVGDEVIPLGFDELASLDEKTSEAELLELVDPDEVPVEMYGQLYFLAPEPPARSGQRRKPLEPGHSRLYVTLRESLRRTGMVAIVSISLRNRSHRGILYASDNTIMLRMLLWPAQVREPRFVGYPDGVFPECEVTEDEIDEASRQLSTLAGKFDPDRYIDPYATRLAEIIAAKSPRPGEPAPEPGGQVIDLVSRLDAAVQRATAG